MYFKPFINLPIGSKGYDTIKRPLDDGRIMCEVCGKRIEYYNNRKYCSECQEKVNLHKTRIRMRKLRKDV